MIRGRRRRSPSSLFPSPSTSFFLSSLSFFLLFSFQDICRLLHTDAVFSVPTVTVAKETSSRGFSFPPMFLETKERKLSSRISFYSPSRRPKRLQHKHRSCVWEAAEAFLDARMHLALSRANERLRSGTPGRADPPDSAVKQNGSSSSTFTTYVLVSQTRRYRTHGYEAHTSVPAWVPLEEERDIPTLRVLVFVGVKRKRRRLTTNTLDVRNTTVVEPPLLELLMVARLGRKRYLLFAPRDTRRKGMQS